MKSIDKKLIIDELLKKVDDEISKSEGALETAESYKYEDDMKSEGKYDTRSIEAGYLAGAQKKRVEELKLEKQLLEENPVKHFTKDEEITIGALVEIEHNKQSRYYFLSTSAGGSLLKIGEDVILVISVFSPIGSSILNLKAGDSFEIEHAGQLKEYSIIQVS